MKASYETDVVAWANEQAALIRGGHLDHGGKVAQLRLNVCYQMGKKSKVYSHR